MLIQEKLFDNWYKKLNEAIEDNSPENLVDYNANPQGKNEGDCTIRSLSLAYDLDYNRVKNELNGLARQNNGQFNTLPILQQFMEKHKYREEFEEGSISGTVEDFSKRHRYGVFVVFCTDKIKQDTSHSFHLVAIVNGKIYDTWDSSKYYAIKAWSIKSNNRTVRNIENENR